MYSQKLCIFQLVARVLVICSTLLFTSLKAAGNESAQLYFPPINREWATITPKDVGWDVNKIEQVLQYVGSQKSSGLVVLYNGRILAERYWAVSSAENKSSPYSRLVFGATQDSRALEDVASAQKSIVSFLIAVAREKKLLDIDRSVSSYLGNGWSNASKAEENRITVRHLMSMTSGLTISLKAKNPPGKAWEYNTSAYSKTIPILSAATGRSIHELTRDWLTDPTGMRESIWVTRAWATRASDANSIGYVTSVRDLARFGLLVLANGNWDGKRIIKDHSYLKEALQSSQQMNPAYGLLWWLNDQNASADKQEANSTFMVPEAPNDMVAVLGALNRLVYIVPSKDLVVARMGDASDSDFAHRFWQLLSDAMK